MKTLRLLVCTALIVCLGSACQKYTDQQDLLGKYVAEMRETLPKYMSPFRIQTVEYTPSTNIVRMEWEYAGPRPNLTDRDVYFTISEILRTPTFTELCALIVPAGAELRIAVGPTDDKASQPLVYPFSADDIDRLLNSPQETEEEVEPQTPEPQAVDTLPDPNELDRAIAEQHRQDVTTFIVQNNRNLPRRLDDGIWLNAYEADDDSQLLTIMYGIDEEKYDMASFNDPELRQAMQQAIMTDLRSNPAMLSSAKRLFSTIRVRFVGDASGRVVDYNITTDSF